MTSLLHDNFEDVKPQQFKDADWTRFDEQFQTFLKEIPEGDRTDLGDRLQWLTIQPDETYYGYIGRLLDQAQDTPEVVRVKLVDRLDNTFDMRVDIEDPLQETDFFEHIFQMMFSNTYQGYNPDKPHSPIVALNGAERLYQLFKNIVLMSLVRQKQASVNDAVVQGIFDTLAHASIKEAQRIALHIFGYHDISVAAFRELILETMAYTQKGGIDSITTPSRGHPLDGLSMAVFDNPKPRTRKRRLTELYKDKPLMIETAIAFIVIFLSFLNNRDFYVHGISAEGVHPETG